MAKRAEWREEFVADLVPRAEEEGIEVFNEKHWDKLWSFIERCADSKMKASIRKHYRRARKMSDRGRRTLVGALEKLWKPNANTTRKNKKPKGEPKPIKVKEHAGVVNDPKPGVYCDVLEGGCGKPIDECRCDNSVERTFTPSCMACADTRRNSKGGLCVCVSGSKRNWYGKKPQMIFELRAQGIFRNGHGGVESQPKAVLEGMVEKSRCEAEGTTYTPSKPKAPKKPKPPAPKAKPKPPPPSKPKPPAPKAKITNPVEQAWGENFPEDGCAHDRIDVKLGACKICGEVVQEPQKPAPPKPPGKPKPPVPPKPPKLATPAPPVKKGKSYGPPAKPGPKPPPSKPTMEVCFSVRLDGSLNGKSEVAVEEIKSYLVERTGFEASVQKHEKLARKDGKWVDLLIHYSMNITDVYGVLLEHESITDAEAKPAVDFGQVEGW